MSSKAFNQLVGFPREYSPTKAFKNNLKHVLQREKKFQSFRSKSDFESPAFFGHIAYAPIFRR